MSVDQAKVDEPELFFDCLYNKMFIVHNYLKGMYTTTYVNLKPHYDKTMKMHGKTW